MRTLIALIFITAIIFMVVKGSEVSTQLSDNRIKDFNVSFDHQTKGESIPDFNQYEEYARKVARRSYDSLTINNVTFDEVYSAYTRIMNYTDGFDDQYAKGEYIETVQELVRNNYKGDCDDFAMFYYVMARKLGYPARYVVGFNNGTGHAWIEIQKNGEWVEVQSTGYRYSKNEISREYTEIKKMELI